jgi:hypothetical protein
MDAIFPVLVVIGLIVLGIYQSIKSQQEAREQEEARRRLNDAQPFQPPQSPEGVEPAPPQTRPGGGRSLLDQLREMIEVSQGIERPRPAPPRPMPPPQARPTPMPAPTPAPSAPRVVRRRARPVEATPQPGPRPLPQPPVERPIQAREVPPLETHIAPVKTAAVERGSRTLGEILASPHSDLAKAVLLGEILGSPLAKRRGRVPRHRD